MTGQIGFERTLSDWLATENAPDVPEWVYEGAFVETRTTRQARPIAEALTRWLRPRDTLPGPPAYRRQRLAGKSLCRCVASHPGARAAGTRSGRGSAANEPLLLRIGAGTAS